MEAVFTINGKEYRINPKTVPIETTLNTFIRSHARLTGTKFMCSEGGCGVCVVNISGIKTPNGESRSIAVNSCLWLVYACDQLNVTTIEGIGSLKNGYHPIQNALWHFNGTQCGYCSPAMVMNMYSLLEANNGKVTMEEVENSFAGHICRCTGYRPILDAFKSLATDSCAKDIEDLMGDFCKISNNNRKLCKKRCTQNENEVLEFSDDAKMWIKAVNIPHLVDIFKTKTQNMDYMLVAGNTAHGVYRRPENIRAYIDISSIPQLHSITADDGSLVFGANVSLTEFMRTLEMTSSKWDHFKYCSHVAKHIDLVATVAVRNAGTIAGNLSIKHQHNEFPSDIFLLLETIGVQLNIGSVDGSVITVPLKHYITMDMRDKVIFSIVFPKLPSDQFVFRSYKIMPRAQNAHAIVNAAFLFEFETKNSKKTVRSCRICYGGINPKFIHAEKTESLLNGIDNLYTNETLKKVIKSLQDELDPDSVLTEASPEYRKNLAISLFYRFLLNTSTEPVKDEYKSGAASLDRPLSSGTQSYQTDEKLYPLTQPSAKYDGRVQCSGEAIYSNDIFSTQTVENELWAAYAHATQVHAKMVRIDASKALKIPGVCAFYSAKDIPGINSFMTRNAGLIGIEENEEIFLSLNSEVLYFGQPCGIIVANTMALANLAAKKVEIQYEKIENPKPIVSSLSHWIEQNRSKSIENTTVFKFSPTKSRDSHLIGAKKNIKGDASVGGQYHYTLEPQTTFCTPNEDGGVNVYSASQYIDLIQVAIAKNLNLPQSKIFASVKHMGGAYGAKISRPAQVACACALACHLLRSPVRFVLTMESNMTTVGKRNAMSWEYDATVNSTNGQILSFEVTITEDYGCSLNDDPSYFVKDVIEKSQYGRSSEWKVKLNRLKTDAASATWCRSPGTFEGVIVLEYLIEQIAHELNLDANKVRLANMDNGSALDKILPEFLKDTDYYERKSQINEFNKQNRWRKKGIAISCMQFPIIYFSEFISYVAVYHGDGTVTISHGGGECGQGIHTKVAQVAAHFLNIPLSYITIVATDTVIAANTTLTGGSITSEAVCMATKNACETIISRLKPVRDSMPKASWVEIVQAASDKFIDLTTKGVFKSTEGKPYNVAGCSCTEIELDVLTGNTQITRVDIVEDTGESLNPLVDVGQIEGAFMMGVGYWLTEKLEFDRQSGELLTNRSWYYKTPGAKDIPIDFRIKFLQNDKSSGLLRSKATGEPAVTMSISVLFALRHAINSVRADNGDTKKWYRLGTGNTPDVVFTTSNINVDDFKLN